MCRYFFIVILISTWNVGCSEIEVPFAQDATQDASVNADTNGNTGSCETNDECDDKNACTANRCNDGQCVFPPAQDICVIDDECVLADTINDADQCLICDPERDSNAWSGRICDDNNPGTKDSCGSSVGCLFEPINECPEGHAQPDCKECLNGWQDNDDDGSCQPTCQGAELNCGAHGNCDDSSGIAICICAPEYQGDACKDCIETHQDNDADGTCNPTCTTAALDCGENGGCEDSSGTALCICNEEYAGDLCENCAEGFQDNDTNNTCEPACDVDANTCGSKGSCDDTSGSAVCACEQGYTGELCDVCAEGFQDNNQNGSCEMGCDNPVSNCGQGTCNDADGIMSCTCQDGWTGSYCDTCEQGYVLIDGACVPACNPADCGQFETCGQNNECVCAPGFAVVGAGCSWVGVGLDTEFNQPDAWSTQGTASVQDSVALFPLECSWASVSTKVVMPEYSDALPLKVKLSLLPSTTPQCTQSDCLNIPIFLKINGHTKNFQHDHIGDDSNHSPLDKDPKTASFCLPPSGYGGEVEFEFFNGPSTGQFAEFKCNGEQFATWVIDSFELIEDKKGDCLTPGLIGDNQFDKQNLSWSLASDSPDSVAFMQDNELVLKTYEPCYKASATQTVMSPGDPKGAGKSLALLFDYRATKNADLRLTVGDTNVRRLEAKGIDTMETQTVCLHKPFVASEIPIAFEVGSCAKDNKSTAYVDNVRFEYVDGCETTELLMDGGFEAAANGHISWGLYGFKENVTIQTDKAYSGAASALLSTQSPCYENGVLSWFIIPEGTKEGGPALTLTYDYPANQLNSVPKLVVGEMYGPYKVNNGDLAFKQENLSETLDATEGWKEHKVCLDPLGAGRRARIKLGLFGGPGVCGDVYDTESMWVDDIKVGLDPQCPGF